MADAAETSPGSIPGPANHYIVSAIYDGVFFIYSPLIALVLGTFLFYPTIAPSVNFPLELPSLNANFSKPLVETASKVFIQAHLVLVFLRSHLNPKINQLHPIRFFLVPGLLLITCLSSQVAMICAVVLAVWWDVYHSALQTFGLGRIYDSRHGNDADLGRQADRVLNIAIYFGPILAGTNLWAHLQHFKKFERVDMESLAKFGNLVFAQQPDLQITVFAIGIPVVVGYLLYYRRLVAQGYFVSTQKVVLFTLTALCSICAWGFMAPAKAFFVMNFFHALQYFAIVWWSEKKNMISLFGLARVPFRVAAALLILIVPAFSYGAWVVVRPGQAIGVVVVSVVVSLMHFWYDGFVWSVRKQQV
jgi:hypothetical protein